MRKLKSLIAAWIGVCVLFCQMSPAFAATNWFLVQYPDPHFNLAVEPNRTATVEEFIAVVTAISYYSKGVSTTPATDKTGKQPSAWCAKYVQAEVDKGTFDPKAYAYSEPATVAFAAEYLSNCKGKYHYDYQNVYNFSNTSGLTAEQRMYLNVAAEYKLIPYTSGMNAKQAITRASLNSYLLNKELPTVAEPVTVSDGGMKELHVYFPNDSPFDESDDAAQLAALKQNSSNITMVSFHAAYISNHGPNQGNQFLKDNIDYASIREAIDFCNQNGILPLLSISNYGTSGYDSATIMRMLSSESNINVCVSEIMAMVQKYNLKGVNIGFEFVDVSARNAYIQFLTKLNTALDARGLLLMNTIGAYFTADEEAASFYDYATIGSLSDYVHIILYDDFSDTSYNEYKVLPGPISNIVRVDRVLKYAVNRIPAGKILIGLATFGIDYNTTTHKAIDTPRSTLLGRAPNGVTELADSLGGTFEYTSSDGQHVVYLETDNGIHARLLRMYRYGLCGASVFYLGSAHPALMQNAASLSANKAEVMNAVRAGIVPQTKRNLYKNAITRAEFCDLIVSMITAKTGKDIDSFLSEKGVSRASGKFSDTNAANVLSAAALGIVNGRDTGNFAPNDAITRQEAAAMLSRLAKCMGYSGNAASVSFSDTSGLAAWAQESIAYISAIADPTNSKRVMNGTGTSTFSPYRTYTREQAYMTMIRLFHAL